MFFVHRVTDTIGIPPQSLALPTRVAVQEEIDKKYPGRVWMDIGLVICRYHHHHHHHHGCNHNNDKDNHNNQDTLVGPGVCVAGDAVAHVVTTFSLVVFRPFLDEVCLGTICASNSAGIQISLGGFFDQIFVPSYWMLRPTTYEADTGLWVWTPEYEDDEDNDDDTNEKQQQQQQQQQESNTRYEMEIGAVVRFKVKSIQFARVTQTAKGRQATLSTTDGGASALPLTSAASSASASASASAASSAVATTASTNMTTKTTSSTTTFHDEATPSSTVTHHVRRRSSSVSLKDDNQAPPPPMKILASICEDGLGVVSWWEAGDEDDEQDEQDEEQQQQQQQQQQQHDNTTSTETVKPDEASVKSEKGVIKRESI